MTVHFGSIHYFQGPKNQVIDRVQAMHQQKPEEGVIGSVRVNGKTAEGVVLTREDFVQHLIDDYGLKPKTGSISDPNLLRTLNTPDTMRHMMTQNQLVSGVGIAARLEDGRGIASPQDMITGKLFDYLERRRSEFNGLDATNQPINDEVIETPPARKHWWQRG